MSKVICVHYFTHCDPNDVPSIELASHDMAEMIHEHIDSFDESTVEDFLEYWKEYHSDADCVISFLENNRDSIIKCGTIDDLSIDVFFVESQGVTAETFCIDWYSEDN